MTTKEQLLSILKKLEKSGEKISVSKVAEIANVSHSLIYNQYPDILQKIKDAKKQAKVEKEKLSDFQTINKLMAENKALKKQLSQVSKDDSLETIEQLTSYIQELYSMYDSLLEERNAFAERLIESS